MEALGLKKDGKPDLSRDKNEEKALKNNEEKAFQDAKKLMASAKQSQLFASYYKPLVAD